MSKKETADQNKQDTQEQQQTTIRWEGGNMRNTYANVCNVTSSREEVTLLFGTNQNWHAGQKDLVVDLSDRMTLNPYAAKRLSILLSNTIAEYEKLFGVLELNLPEQKTE